MLSQKLLQKGFLLRGGIKYGKMYSHKYSAYGSAYMSAYKMEEQEAIYPRVILCDKSVEYASAFPFNLANGMIWRDRDGYIYANALQLLEDRTDGAEDITAMQARHKPVYDELKICIERGIAGCRTQNHRSKWLWLANYFNDFIRENAWNITAKPTELLIRF